MKKIYICLLSLMLLGCQGTSQNKDATLSWEGQYKKGDVTLKITLESDFPDGVKYDIVYQGKDMSDYATYEDSSRQTAMCAVTEDGYTLRFTLKQDKVIIDEKDGQSYLGINLSGDYQKE